MWRIISLALLALGAVGVGLARAQQAPAPEAAWGAFRDTIDAFQPPPYQLRPFVLPGSERLYLNGARLDTAAYRIDYRRGRVWLERRSLQVRAELVAVYRTYPFQFQAVYRRHRLADSTEASSEARAVVAAEGAASSPAPINPFAGLKLERSGSISRGVIGGSNRDVNIASGLRMQLSGEVADGVTLQAMLTDANTPLQPEGTTQRLNDFDRVFMQIDAPPGQARLGDVEVAFDGSTFGRFARKLQGAVLSTSQLDAVVPGAAAGQVTAVGATTRGRFRTQQIEPIDGVQGPYRLEGADGERFIIVIAGSERVYLDGERLTRGKTNDYVIDYAQAEITFTADRMITADRRITVEFEYTTSGFNRTLIGADTQLRFGRHADGTARFQLGATFLREADSRTFNQAFDLTAADSLLLAAAGDGAAVRSGAEEVPFDAEAPYVQYRRTVRSSAEGADTVFVALDEAPAPGTPVYRVRFERIGDGRGTYARVGRSVNGIVYEYRGPEQGAYAPIRRLPRPIQQRLLDVRGQFRPLPGLAVFGEWAQSLHDQNRLSGLDSQDDRGQSYHAGLRLDSLALGGSDDPWGTLSATLERRHRGAHFSAFNRTRPVEFARQWNLAERGAVPPLLEGAAETTDRLRLAFSARDWLRLAGGVGRLQLGEGFAGQRQTAALQLGQARGPRLTYDLARVRSEDAVRQIDGQWLRQHGTLAYRGDRWQPTLAVRHEVRRQQAAQTDSLAPTSFAFVEWIPQIAYQTGAMRVSGSMRYRQEQEAAHGRLRDAARAWTVQSELQYDPSDSYDARVQIGYRTRQLTSYFRSRAGRLGTESLLVRMASSVRPWDGALDAEAFYDARTERTPTLQEVYVRTGPELGQYVWTDLDGDGIIQTGEFVPETTPNEGTYVQRFVPSDSLMPVASVQARLRVQLDPSRLWGDGAAWWQQALAQVRMQTTFGVEEQTRASDLASIYLLDLSRFRQPGTTVNGQLRLRQDLYLFSGSTRYGVDASFQRVQGLSERAVGVRTRLLNTWRVEGRYRLGARWSVSVAGTWGRNRSASEAFAARSYDIEHIELRPEARVQLHPAVGVTAGLVVGRKVDAVGPRTARMLRVPMEVRWARAGRFRLTARGEVAHIDLDGAAQGLARFELTEGRGPGTSLLWRLQGQYQITDALRATLAYDGRAPAGAPTINTFRVQMSASF